MNVVVIPCFNRPEFLYVTLEFICKAKGYEKNKYLFCCDHGFNVQNINIIKSFPQLNSEIVIRKNHFPKLTKQSFNVLEGYRQACNMSDELVYLIEDDIFISEDFFNWHEKVHAKDKCFCSIATRNNNTEFDTSNDVSAYYYGVKSDYQSLGVCWNKQVLIDEVLPFATRKYYNSPVTYCKYYFPESVIGHYFVEQDGLIRRIKEKNSGIGIFTHVPRAYHGGFYSYNRNKHHTFVGKLEDKITMIKTIIDNTPLYKKYCFEDRFYKDSMPCNLNFLHDGELILKPLKPK